MVGPADLGWSLGLDGIPVWRPLPVQALVIVWLRPFTPAHIRVVLTAHRQGRLAFRVRGTDVGREVR
jgi:hypothetical protein